MQGNNYGNNKGIGERIKEAIPGTEEHRATHGVTPGHANVEGMKSHLPGTEEHRMREAGVIGGGSAMTGTHGTGTQAHGTMGERIKESIPGTREYEATHGMTGAHRGAEQMKAHIPGTEEHHMRTGVEAGHGMGVMGTGVGTGYGHNTGMGTGTAYDTHHTGVGTGIGGVGTHHTGMAGTGVGTGGIDPETGKETMGHKIKKMIPGTEENKEKKLAQGRI